MAVVSHKSVISPLLVGRASYLGALERLLEESRQGHGQLALLTGEAGIGKSRLVSELKRKAIALGCGVVEGHCDEPDQLIPYAPLLEILRTGLNAPAPDVNQRLGPAAATLAKLFPELEWSVTTPEPPPDQEKRLLHHGLTRYLEEVARQRSLLLIVEDLHWSDEATLDFLLYLVRRLASLPICLLLTYRSDEISAGLGRFLAAVERQRFAVEISLPRLTMRQIDEMVRAIFELARPVRGDFLQAVSELTEGNPFFIEEVLKALLAAGDIYYSESAWDRRPMGELHIPRSVSDAVQRRATNLSAPARQLLLLAAVAGQRFDVAVLQAVTQQDDVTLLASLKELVAAQFVVETGADEFSFRHALAQQALYATLLARERHAMHRTLAQAISHRHAGMLDAHVPALAHHYHAGGAWEEALLYTRRAGVQAERLYMPQAAVKQYSRAIEAASHLATSSIIPLDLASIYRARGLAYETLGDFDHALADLEKALTLVRGGSDEQAMWQAEWQLLIDLGFLWASRDYARTGEYYQQALVLADRLEESSLLAHTYNRVGNWHLNRGETEQTLQAYHQALALFEALNDRRGLAQTLDLLGMVSVHVGDPKGLFYYEQAATFLREVDDRAGLVSTLAMLAPMRVIQGGLAQAAQDAARADVELGEAIEVAQQIGYQAGEAFALIEYSQILGWRGDFGAAFAAAERSLTLAQEIEHHQWIAASQLALGGIYLDLQLPEGARRYLEQALALAEEVGSQIFSRYARGCLAMSYLEMGEVGLAEKVMNEANLDVPVTFYDHFFWCASILLALRRNEPTLALQLIDQCSPAFFAADHNNWLSLSLRLAYGEALAMLGDANAEGVLRAVCDGAQRKNVRSLLWRSHIDLGKYLLGQKRVDEAERDFARARVLIEELAAGVDDEVLRNTFRQRALAMIPPMISPTPRQAAKRAFDGLTTTEQQVAALVMQGKSNREIAAAQVVSIKTVEAHISHILSKLGFSSRAQIAAWAVEKGFATASSGEDG